MRIAIFSESFEPVVNGVTTSIQTLREALHKLGHTTFVYAPRFPGHHDSDPNVFRFPSILPPNARDYPLAVPFKNGFLSRMRGMEIDIVHAQTPFMLGWTGLRAGRRLGIPVVSTNHTQYAEYTHYFPLLPPAWSRAAVIPMLRRYYDSCDLVVTPSQANREILLGYGVRREIRVVPTGNSLEIARDEDTRMAVRRHWDVPEDARVLLCVGRLAKEKNLSLLLNSFERLAGNHPAIRQVFVGGGPYEEELKREIARRGLSGRVIVAGPVPREKVGHVYCGGDIFVFPSMTETQGLVLGEALAAGLPCVAVNAGGSPEMLCDGEDSFLCANDCADFTEKVERLLTDEDLRRRFSASAIDNSARFTSEEMALRMLDAYKSVLPNR